MQTFVLKNCEATPTQVTNNYPDWHFKSMGELSKLPQSQHYHISTGQKDQTGIVELTFYQENKLPCVEIKLAHNRQGTWGQNGFNQLKRYLSATLGPPLTR